MNKKIIGFIAFIFVLSGCTSTSKPSVIAPGNIIPVGKYAISEETSRAYQSWLETKAELDKVQTVISYNFDEYLDNHADAIYLATFSEYDAALQLVDEMPPIYDKTVAVIASMKAQKDFPEVEQLKTLLSEMMSLEKLSTENLEKHIQALKAGQSATARKYETLYVQYYKEAMVKSRAMYDLNIQTLTRGGKIEGQKLVEENTPPVVK
jgi:hypothetical protein